MKQTYEIMAEVLAKNLPLKTKLKSGVLEY